ncbi:TetR/AcrR family transcriptional regulator C-terminal domain-containing protein [Actinophytocola gossypii]
MTDDLEHDLRQFARRHIDEVTQPHLIQLRRIIIAEADRFPNLAKTWFTNGPERAHATLATQFQELERRGLLTVPDPVLAAQYFNWLVLSIPLNKAMFHPDHKSPPPRTEPLCRRSSADLPRRLRGQNQHLTPKTCSVSPSCRTCMKGIRLLRHLPSQGPACRAGKHRSWNSPRRCGVLRARVRGPQLRDPRVRRAVATAPTTRTRRPASVADSVKVGLAFPGRCVRPKCGCAAIGSG